MVLGMKTWTKSEWLAEVTRLAKDGLGIDLELDNDDPYDVLNYADDQFPEGVTPKAFFRDVFADELASQEHDELMAAEADECLAGENEVDLAPNDRNQF